MTQPEFDLATLEKALTEALRLIREGDVLGLAESPLAHVELLQHWFIRPTVQTSTERGQAVQAMIYWLIDRLRPLGEQAWLALRWRQYNVLNGFFLEGMKIAELAEQMAVAEQTIYPMRNQATNQLAKILFEALEKPQIHANYAFEALYPQLPIIQQTLIRMVALIDEPLELTWLQDLAINEGFGAIEPTLYELCRAEFIVDCGEQNSYTIQPKLRADARGLITLAERNRWHSLIGNALAPADPLRAATYLRQAHDFESAAQLLISNAQQITDRLQGFALAQLLNQFQPHEISDNDTWMRLKLVCGDVALTMNDIETALNEYQQALAADDVLIKAEAYFKRGKAFRLRNTAEAIAHFTYSISLLKDDFTSHELLYRVYLEQAWMWFQDRHDQAQAKASLQSAEGLISSQQRGAWAELFNAWGQFYSHQGNYQEAIQYHQQAWLAANEVQDTLLMTHLAHNLGNDYLGLRDYKQALNYFQQSLDLASKTGNRRITGLCQKSIGACCFWLAEYRLAIEHYQQAYAIFQAMHNQNWQANTCYDLAEAYAELGETEAMHRYYVEAVELAHAAQLERLLDDLGQLAQQYGLHPPVLTLNPRQQQIFDYLKQHPSITNRTYRELTKVSPKQAARDLNQLVEAGMLTRIGDGRSTSYIIE